MRGSAGRTIRQSRVQLSNGKGEQWQGYGRAGRTEPGECRTRLGYIHARHGRAKPRQGRIWHDLNGAKLELKQGSPNKEVRLFVVSDTVWGTFIR